MTRNFDQNERSAVAARLAGGVSHDANNRIGAIAGFATLIRMKSADADIKKKAGEIITICRTSGEMVKTLLNIIREDKQQGEVVVNAHEVAGIAADLLYNGLCMSAKFICELNAKYFMAIADPVQLQCAILSAGLKAADTAQHGGTVAVTTENTEENDRRYLKITVSGGGYEETLLLPTREKG